VDEDASRERPAALRHKHIQRQVRAAAVKLARASAAADRAQAKAIVQKVLTITKDAELQKEARGLLARLK